MTVDFVPLFLYKISKMVSFVLSQEFNDGRNICNKFTKFQRWSVLLGYEISTMLGFVPLFLDEFSKTVGFVTRV